MIMIAITKEVTDNKGKRKVKPWFHENVNFINKEKKIKQNYNIK